MKYMGWILITAAMALNMGCASENKGSNPAVASDGRDGTGTAAVPGAPAGTGDSAATTGYASGSTVTLVPSSIGALQRMFYKTMPSNPQNLRINMDVTRGQNSIIISWVEGGVVHEFDFGTTHPISSVSDTSLNKWYTANGATVWKGFFQDSFGAIVIVMDRAIGAGDGKAPSIIGGSIWFQNFALPANGYLNADPHQGTTKMCWQISMGNHDCRTFLVGGNINMTSSLYPSGYGPNMPTGYEKLGDFDGLSRTAAGL